MKSTDGWYVGESELDRREWGFDGTVWAPPTSQEQDAEAAGGPPADCYLVAEGIRHGPHARLIAAAPDLLAACKKAAAMLSCGCPPRPDRDRTDLRDADHGPDCPIQNLEQAIARAEGAAQ